MKRKTLRPVFPNCGIERAYRRKLYALTHEMAQSYVYWLKACYRRNEPVLAQDEYARLGIDPLHPNPDGSDYHLMNAVDERIAKMAFDASPAKELEKTLRKLFRHWSKRFNLMAPQLADYFSTAAHKRSDAVLKKILKDGGISVKFTMSPAMRDVFHATVQENVALIKSIPQQFHTQVEGAVMRSVQSGRDLHSLVRDIKSRYNVSIDRAKLIALDQNNKATSVFIKVRQDELGIKKAVWLHSHAGKEPRPTHLANHGKQYDVSEGWFDPDPKVRRRIWPGELIRCRCVSKSVVPGFT